MRKATSLSGGSAWLLVAAFAFLCAKLWLVHDLEIRADEGHHDDLLYLECAHRWYWQAPYNEMTVLRPPGYPLWIALVHATGIPLRIAVEIWQAAGALVVAVSLVRTGLSRLCAGCCYAALIFHPSSFMVNSLAFAETFYAGLLWFTAGALLFQLVTRRMAWALAAGAALGILWITREESMLLVGCVVVVVVLELLRLRPKAGAWAAAIRTATRPVLAVTGAVAAIVLSVCVANFACFGIFSISDFTTAPYESAMKALLRIRPPERTALRLALTHATLRQAYGSSAALRELEPYFEGDPGRGWQQFTRESLHLDDEWSWGWFCVVLRDFTARAGHYKSARETTLFYNRLALEINQACDRGALPSRWAFSAFIDPDIGKLAAAAPNSVRRTLAMFTRTYHSLPRESLNHASVTTCEFFDLLCGRRSAITRPRSVEISGWAFGNANPVSEIFVIAPDRQILASAHPDIKRPDVVKAFEAQFDVALLSGFRIASPVDSSGKLMGDLVFQVHDGKKVTIPAAEASHPGPFSPPPMKAGEFRHFIESISLPPPDSQTAAKARGLISRFNPPFVIALTWTAIAALALLARRGRFHLSSPILAATMLFGYLIASRVALIIVSDLTWMDPSTRYLFPVMPLYTCLLAVIIFEAVRTWFAGSGWRAAASLGGKA